MQIPRLILLGALPTAASWIPAAAAKTMYVEKWGKTGTTVVRGTKSTPCSTIVKALALASRNDKIVVGAGRYGGNTLST